MRVFVTGATGFVGSAVARELLAAGHQVLGLARSDAGAQQLRSLGVPVHRGDVEDLDSLRRGAARCDAVIHTAFTLDLERFVQSSENDRRAIEALGDELHGSSRPLIVTSGVGIFVGSQQGVIEEDSAPPAGPQAVPRVASEQAADALAQRGVNVSVVRLAPVHGVGDRTGFLPLLIALARGKGVSAYIGEGGNRWPALHILDAAGLYRLVLERNQTPGARYHGAPEQGLAFRQIAAAIAGGLRVPAVGLDPGEAPGHFGGFTPFAAMDLPTSARRTREQLGWEPTHIGLLADLQAGAAYFPA